MTTARLYGKLCYPHSHGVDPNAKPFFHPGCEKCQQKLADKKVTGNEPLPPTLIQTLAARGGSKRRLHILKARKQPWAS